MKKNIAEILKDQREDLPLWSPAYGNVELKKATDTGVIIRTKCGYFQLDVDGKIYAEGECMLFPSPEQRDWDKFWPYKDGDVVRTFIVEIRYPECDNMLNAENYLQELIEGDLADEDVGRWRVNVKEVPHRAIEKEGKIWNPVKKELVNIEIVAAEEKKEKFDINTLKPFDKVLARDSNEALWVIELWMAYAPQYKKWKYQCLGSTYDQCIPYEGNEHLVTKADMPDEYYITWEEEK